MQKKICIVVSLGVALILCLSGCADSGEEKNEEQESKTLNVGTQANYIGAPAYYAYEKGYFEDAGLDVELVVFDSGAPINEALAAKEIDIGQSGFASIYSMTSDVCTWVMEVDDAVNNTGLYCREDSPILETKNADGIYGSAESIKGMSAIVTVGTTSQFHAEKYASLFGLDTDEIKELSMDLSAQYQAFVSGEGDLLATSGTVCYQLEDEGYVNLGNFNDIVGLSLCDGVTVRNEILENRRDDVVTYIKCIQKALDELGSDEELRYSYLKEFYAARGQDIEESVLKRLAEDVSYMTTEVIKKPEYTFGYQWDGITDFLLEKNKIDQIGKDNVSKNIDVSLWKEASGIDMKSAE